MVKIDRRDTKSAKAAIASLAREREKSSGTYNTDEVNDALQEIFHGKCYICENKDVSSWQIEHLIPHKEDPALKFDWDNLFLSCAHCNNTKLGKYDPILDCTQIEPDEYIAFRKVGYFGTDETLEFEALNQLPETQNTCALLEDVYYGHTPQKRAEARFIRKKLRDELTKFKNYVRDYADAAGSQKDELFCTIQKELKGNSPFAAFKRWLIRDHQDKYGDLMNCWKEN